MEYFSNSPAPFSSDRLPKPKEIQHTDHQKRKTEVEEKG
jgi:hypothetical protein